MGRVVGRRKDEKEWEGRIFGEVYVGIMFTEVEDARFGGRGCERKGSERKGGEVYGGLGAGGDGC